LKKHLFDRKHHIILSSVLLLDEQKLGFIFLFLLKTI